MTFSRNHVPDHLQYDLYTDGGCIKTNPSALGGTWAWTLVDRRGNRVECDSGVIVPQDFDVAKITNNQMELYAAVMGLEAMRAGWCGMLYTDSQVTLYRLTVSYKFNGISSDLKQRCLRLRANKLWTPLLCGGHPTKQALADGYDHRGYPVHLANVWCDDECKRNAHKFLSRKEGK